MSWDRVKLGARTGLLVSVWFGFRGGRRLVGRVTGCRGIPWDGEVWNRVVSPLFGRRAVLALDRMDTSVGPVAHVARRRDAELVGDGALDDVEDLVAVVLMHRELGARRETREKRVPLGGLISP